MSPLKRFLNRQNALAAAALIGAVCLGSLCTRRLAPAVGAAPLRPALPAPGATGPPPLPPARRGGQPVLATEYAQQLLGIFNQERARLKLAPLKWDAQLAHAAAAHSLTMGRADFYAHNGPDGTPLQRMNTVGFPGSKVWGEGIAVWYPNPAEVGAALLAHPGNHWLIVSPALTHIGIAAVEMPISRWSWYWTMDYGVRR